MFNHKPSDGHANVSSTDQEPEVNDDGGMRVRTAKGSEMEFVHHSTGKLLATVCIATGGRSEVQVTLPEEIKGDAHTAIKPAAEGMDEECIDALAKRLPAIRRKSDKEHKWRLPVTITHKDAARVMLATQGMLEGMVFNTETLRWLCDLCTDTDLVSRDFATREKLDIDTTVRIRISMAGGSSFLTDSVATVKLPIIDIKDNKHILKIRAHVADIGKKKVLGEHGGAGVVGLLARALHAPPCTY